MADLDCCFLTFNCARVLLEVNYFADCLHEALSKRDAPPDLFVFALEEIAPLGYAFLGGSFLAPYLKRFEAALDLATEKWGKNAIRYESIMVTNAGMTGLMVFAQPDVATDITKIETAGVGVGDYDLGNKGAVGVRLGYQQGDMDATELTFVGAHLAPMEEAWERRNADWKMIVENLIFTAPPTSTRRPRSTVSESEPLLSSSPSNSSNPTSMYKPTSHLFVAGDLNYRTSDLRPHPDDHKSWPTPSPFTTSSSAQPMNEDLTTLFTNDQLTREKSQKHTLHHLHESSITFPPTYKYNHKAQELAAAHAANPAATAVKDTEYFLWAPHRIPSWCDRVLYTLAPGAEPKVEDYKSLPLQPGSDHQPVLLTFKVPLTPILKEGWNESPFAIAKDWKERRSMARSTEILVGVVAYLTMTFEGRAILFGTVVGAVGGWYVLRSMLL